MKERQSNIELLRIISMFFIVLEHILIMGTDFFTSPIGNQLHIANAIIGFTYSGVNCFILITGYFGTNFSYRRLLNLYLICGIYELVGFVFAYLQGSAEFSTTALSYIIFPLSRSNTWFIRCYVILLFLLPIINKGIEQLNKKQFTHILILLTILNIYFGWFQKHANFNAIGYNPSQMIYLYVIGRYLKTYVDWNTVAKYKLYVFLLWFLLSFLWGMIQNINEIMTIPHWNGWAYNNPIILMSAISFFMFFRVINIPYSKIINTLGSTMFAVFLIHMNRNIGNHLYIFIKNIIYLPSIEQSITIQVLVLIFCAFLIMFVSVLFDLVRIKLFSRYILKDKYNNI